MFTKSLLLVLLGCTLILANPVQIEEKQVDRTILETVAQWLRKTDDALSNIFEKVKKPFEKVKNLIIETGEGVANYGKEKYHQVLEVYYNLKAKSEQNLNQVKNAFLAKIVDELQKVIDTLSNETDEDTFEKLQEKVKGIANSSKESLEKLQKELQEAINAEKEKLEKNLDEWQNEANKVTKD